MIRSSVFNFFKNKSNILSVRPFCQIEQLLITIN